MISEISAELQLSQLYPGMNDKWIVRNKGSFFRNYSSDVMEIRLEEDTVFIARDGFLRLLPDEVLSEEDELKNPSKKTNLETWEKKEKREILKERLSLLNEAFVPLDSLAFRKQMKLQTAVSDILGNKLNDIIAHYYGFDIENESNQMVKKAAILLPYTVKTRGNLQFIKSLLQEITGHQVEIKRSDYSEKDNTRYWLPMLTFNIIIDDLTSEEYIQEEEKIQPLGEFLREYFLPFEAICEFHVKSSNKNSSLLNYSTAL